jgi:hypothetical protein
LTENKYGRHYSPQLTILASSTVAYKVLRGLPSVYTLEKVTRCANSISEQERRVIFEVKGIGRSSTHMKQMFCFIIDETYVAKRIDEVQGLTGNRAFDFHGEVADLEKK